MDNRSPQSSVRVVNDNALELLRVQHSSWLSNPTTQTLLKCVRKQKEKFVELSSYHATNPSISSEAIRGYVIGIKSCDAVLELLSNTEVLVKFITENKID
jgi:hypothetical protein